MRSQLQVTESFRALDDVIIKGDLSKISEADRVLYYKSVCESIGLNPLTKPFEFIHLNGRMVLYALKTATDQLRQLHDVSIEIISREKIDDIYVVTALAKNASGRTDASIGAVNVAGLKGEALANAFMKAETKAKRRVTLSICGLGMLDETEVEDIPATIKIVNINQENEERTILQQNIDAIKGCLTLEELKVAYEKAYPQIKTPAGRSTLVTIKDEMKELLMRPMIEEDLNNG